MPVRTSTSNSAYNPLSEVHKYFATTSNPSALADHPASSTPIYRSAPPLAVPLSHTHERRPPEIGNWAGGKIFQVRRCASAAHDAAMTRLTGEARSRRAATCLRSSCAGSSLCCTRRLPEVLAAAGRHYNRLPGLPTPHEGSVAIRKYGTGTYVQ